MHNTITNHSVSRRTIILGSGALATGTGAIMLLPDRASASVTMGHIAFSENIHQPEDNEVYDLHALITGEWEYSNLESQPATREVYCLVADQSGENAEAVGMSEQAVADQSASGTYELRGSILASSHYDPADVSPSNGEPVEITIPISVLMLIRDDSKSTLVQAEATGSAPIRIEPGGTVTSAAVGGNGTTGLVDDQGDPTPSFENTTA